MPYDYIANPRNFLYSPGDAGYSSNAWVRADDPTHPFTRWFYHPTLGWKRGLKWTYVGGGVNAWKPSFDATQANCGPGTLSDFSHCNTPPATTNPPTYGAQCTFTFGGGGTTLQVQVQWYIDSVAYGSQLNYTTGPGYIAPITMSNQSTPTTAGTGVDDGNNHVWKFQWRAQLLDGSFTAWTNSGTWTTTYQLCGRPA